MMLELLKVNDQISSMCSCVKKILSRNEILTITKSVQYLTHSNCIVYLPKLNLDLNLDLVNINACTKFG